MTSAGSSGSSTTGGSSGRKSGGFSFDQFSKGLTKGLDLFQKGVNKAQQIKGYVDKGIDTAQRVKGYVDTVRAITAPRPAPSAQPTPAPQPAPATPSEPTAAPAVEPTAASSPQASSPVAASQSPAGLDQIVLLLQALQQHQIPPLPGPAAHPYAAQPYAAPPAVPQLDALTLLRTIVSNPSFQHALQPTPAYSAAPMRSVQLPMPAAHGRPVQIPMGAVMNAIMALAGQSMVELNETTLDDDPEVPSYLVSGDGDFLVDPGNPNDRAALVAHYFRLSDEAARISQPRRRYVKEDVEDESEAFANDIGI